MHQPLKVAVPWSLSHYIPLNGFHPLYRALFDHAPDTIALHAWDNVRLYRRFRADTPIRHALVEKAKAIRGRFDHLVKNSIAEKYQDYFWPPNQVLTTELLGDIEFHHTAPFPSLQRPFVFHCEMFAPLFFPFAHQGTGGLDCSGEIREHYRNILGNPLCLGIWSHIPETIQSISHFFSDPIIDRKLFHSRIGLSASSLPDANLPEKPPLSRPIFLFMNSAHQNPANFFSRGGHIVLRFWKEFLADGREGLLMLRCARPSAEELIKYGVDVSMVRAETGRSIIWAQDYLANHEMNALMASAHFFLLPSASLHSVSIMQAMLLGTIPIVTDTVGTSRYVTDHETGITLNGMRAAIWYHDAATGILMDRYRRIPDLDNSLVTQLTKRVSALLGEPIAYWDMRQRIRQYGQKQFSGQAFSDGFWSEVISLYGQHQQAHPNGVGGSLHAECSWEECMVNREDWARIFESPTQPMARINTGRSAVLEWGGAIVYVPGNSGLGLQLNDWCVLGRHYAPHARQIRFSNTLEELGGSFLISMGEAPFFNVTKLIQTLSKALTPYPRLHGRAARIWRKIRRYRDLSFFRLASRIRGKT